MFITYTWAMCLLTELLRFLVLIEAELEKELGRKPRCLPAPCFPPAREVIVEIACAAFRALLAPSSVLLFFTISLPSHTTPPAPHSSDLFSPSSCWA